MGTQSNGHTPAAADAYGSVAVDSIKADVATHRSARDKLDGSMDVSAAGDGQAGSLGQERDKLKQLLHRKAGSRDASQITKVEERAKGSVDKAVYRAYFVSWGPWVLLPVVMVVTAVIERGLQVLQNYVLADWSNHTADVAADGGEPNTGFYMTVYFTLGLVSIGVGIVRSAILVAGAINASRKLHQALLMKVVRLPMSFFDSQPTGRLLNRFTKDTESLDVQLSGSVNSALTCFVSAALSIVVVISVSPTTVAAIVPLGALYYYLQVSVS